MNSSIKKFTEEISEIQEMNEILVNENNELKSTI